MIAKHYLGWEGWHGVCTTGDIAAGFPPSIVFADAVPLGPGLAPGLVNDDAPASSSPLANGIPGALSLNEGVSVDNGTAVPSGPWLAPGLMNGDAPASRPLRLPGDGSHGQEAVGELATVVMPDGSGAVGLAADSASALMMRKKRAGLVLGSALRGDVKAFPIQTDRLVEYANAESRIRYGSVYKPVPDADVLTHAAVSDETANKMPIADTGNQAEGSDMLTVSSPFLSDPSNAESGAALFAAAQAQTDILPVETPQTQAPAGPTDAQKRAFTAMKYAMFIHWSFSTYAKFDGHDLGYNDGSSLSSQRRDDQGNLLFGSTRKIPGPQLPIFTSPVGVPSQNPVPDGKGGPYYTSRTFESSLFDPPYKNQADFKRHVTDFWARTAKAAGMKYLSFTTKHHQGWCGWPSKYTTFDVETSSAPNLDLVQAVFDSARDFGLKVMLYYSLPDRVHHLTPGVGNDNAAYWQFARNQMDELLAYDEGDGTLIAFWMDVAEPNHPLPQAFGREGVTAFRDYVRSQNSNVIQLYNSFSYDEGNRRIKSSAGIADLPNYETRHDFNLPRRPVDGGNGGEHADLLYNFYSSNANYVTEGRALWFSFEDLRTTNSLRPPRFDDEGALARQIYGSNKFNTVYSLNVQPGTWGRFSPNGIDRLKKTGDLLNGGGRIDDFDLGWNYSGAWSPVSDNYEIKGKIDSDGKWGWDRNSLGWKALWERGSIDSTSFWQKSLHFTDIEGSYAEYKFFGESVKVYLRSAADSGAVNVYIDGVLQRHIMKDYIRALQGNEAILVYSTSSLSYGEHNIRLEAAGGGKVWLDFIEVSPRIEKTEIMSLAGADRVYAAGDTVDVGVTFTGRVKVLGAPQLEIDVGGNARVAEYVSGSGTRMLIFRYAVATGDVDADGISIGANKLSLNGGKIQVDDMPLQSSELPADALEGRTLRSNGGGVITTDADLNHKAMDADDLHKVNGGPSSVMTSGNDLLLGMAGNSAYLLGLGTGFDEVYEGYTSNQLSSSHLRAAGDGGDVIRLEAGIGTGDVRLLRDQDNVWVQVLGAADGSGERPVVASLKLVNYYENDQSKVERIEFADGTEWGHAELHKIAIRGGAGDDSLYGRDDMSDILSGDAGGNDRLLGLGGDDEYRLGLETGFDEVYEGYSSVRDSSHYLRGGSMEQTGGYVSSQYLRDSGDAGDVIRLDAGISASDVVLVRDQSSLWVQVLGEADGGERPVVASLKLVNYYENDQSKVERIVFGDGGEWSGDLLVGSSGSEVLEGSSADETYYGGGGTDTYSFGRDFGSDVVAGDGGSGKAEFSGYGSGQLRFAREGGDLLVSVSEGSSRVRFEDWLVPGGSRTIEAGGSRSLEVAKIIQALSVIQGIGTNKPQSVAIDEDSWTPIASS